MRDGRRPRRLRPPLRPARAGIADLAKPLLLWRAATREKEPIASAAAIASSAAMLSGYKINSKP